MHEICLLAWLPWSHSHECTISDTQPQPVDVLPAHGHCCNNGIQQAQPNVYKTHCVAVEHKI